MGRSTSLHDESSRARYVGKLEQKQFYHSKKEIDTSHETRPAGFGAMRSGHLFSIEKRRVAVMSSRRYRTKTSMPAPQTLEERVDHVERVVQQTVQHVRAVDPFERVQQRTVEQMNDQERDQERYVFVIRLYAQRV